MSGKQFFLSCSTTQSGKQAGNPADVSSQAQAPGPAGQEGFGAATNPPCTSRFSEEWLLPLALESELTTHLTLERVLISDSFSVSQALMMMLVAVWSQLLLIPLKG